MDIPDPMAGLRQPTVAGKLVPVFAHAELRNRENVVWSGTDRPHATRNVAS